METEKQNKISPAEKKALGKREETAFGLIVEVLEEREGQERKDQTQVINQIKASKTT